MSRFLRGVSESQEIDTANLDSLIFEPNSDFNGAMTFNWNGFDGTAYAENAAQVNLSINAIDDPPVVNQAIADLNVDDGVESSVIDLTNVFGDVDGDAIAKSIFANSNENLVTATIVDNQLTLDYLENQSGTTQITIRGTANGQFVDDSFTVIVASGNINTLDIDGNGILELQDYNVIDLYAAQLDEPEFDFLLNNFDNDLIGENATRTDADSILTYLNEVGDSLFDIDGNDIVELQDYNLVDLYAAQLDEAEFDFLLNNFDNDLIGENATRTDADSILTYFETITPPYDLVLVCHLKSALEKSEIAPETDFNKLLLFKLRWKLNFVKKGHNLLIIDNASKTSSI